MQATTECQTAHNTKRELHRSYRIERQYSSPRPLKELVRDLLRAHSGE